MDRFDAMAVFLQAADAGSFSEAGRRLGMPLATVSRKVADLETHLSTNLFTRSTRGLELTPAGHAYRTAAKTILEQLDDAERAAAGEYTTAKGDLIVTAPLLFGRRHVLPAVVDFLAAYPDVDVDLVLSDRTARFVDDHVDVAIRIGDLPDSDLTARVVGAVRRVVCASPDYLAARGRPRTPKDLGGHVAVSYDGLAALGVWEFAKDVVAPTASVRSRLRVNTVDAALAAAVAGGGLVRALSYQVVDEVRAKSLVVVLARFEPRPWPVHVVFDARALLPLKLRAFIDFVTPRLRQRLIDAAL